MTYFLHQTISTTSAFNKCILHLVVQTSSSLCSQAVLPFPTRRQNIISEINTKLISDLIWFDYLIFCIQVSCQLRHLLQIWRTLETWNETTSWIYQLTLKLKQILHFKQSSNIEYIVLIYFNIFKLTFSTPSSSAWLILSIQQTLNRKTLRKIRFWQYFTVNLFQLYALCITFRSLLTTLKCFYGYTIILMIFSLKAKFKTKIQNSQNMFDHRATTMVPIVPRFW